MAKRMRTGYVFFKMKGRRNPYARRLKGSLSAEEARELIQERVWKHFAEWMDGRNGPVITDKQGRAVAGIFRHDVERYLDSLLHGKPTYFD
ncbi:MAG: hypothetical protein HYY58_03545 [Candidatus Omnitrophica bacterium]|nr:hypothetical protein [Candidatus Omnitrophota bacterium]